MRARAPGRVCVPVTSSSCVHDGRSSATFGPFPAALLIQHLAAPLQITSNPEQHRRMRALAPDRACTSVAPSSCAHDEPSSFRAESLPGLDLRWADVTGQKNPISLKSGVEPPHARPRAPAARRSIAPSTCAHDEPVIGLLSPPSPTQSPTPVEATFFFPFFFLRLT
jgi:hypothetical protein